MFKYLAIYNFLYKFSNGKIFQITVVNLISLSILNYPSYTISVQNNKTDPAYNKKNYYLELLSKKFVCHSLRSVFYHSEELIELFLYVFWVTALFEIFTWNWKKYYLRYFVFKYLNSWTFCFWLFFNGSVGISYSLSMQNSVYTRVQIIYF